MNLAGVSEAAAALATSCRLLSLGATLSRRTTRKAPGTARQPGLDFGDETRGQRSLRSTQDNYLIV